MFDKRYIFIFLSILLILSIILSLFFQQRLNEGFNTSSPSPPTNKMKISQIIENQSLINTTNSGFKKGFAGSGSNLKLYGTNFFDPSFNTSYYDSNNYDIQYHDSIDIISTKPDIYGLPEGTTFAQDESGNLVAMLDPKIQKYSTYYPPGTYSQYGATKYVPTYEDSVYLSKTFNFLPKSLNRTNN